MTDILLQEFFNKERWEQALETGVDKHIDKGEGAYYTMKNLLMYHNCFVETDNGIKLYGTKAVGFIESKLDEYQGEGWRMFALMKKVIAINNFDYGARMHELGVKGY